MKSIHIKTCVLFSALLLICMLLAGCGALYNDARYHPYPQYEAYYIEDAAHSLGSGFYSIEGLSDEYLMRNETRPHILPLNIGHQGGFYIRNGAEEPLLCYNVKSIIVTEEGFVSPFKIDSPVFRDKIYYESEDEAVIGAFLQPILNPTDAVQTGRPSTEPAKPGHTAQLLFILDVPTDLGYCVTLEYRDYVKSGGRYFMCWRREINENGDGQIYYFECTELLKTDLMAPLREALEAQSAS